MGKAKPALNGAAQIGACIFQPGETDMACLPLEQAEGDRIRLLPAQ
jgi:hypothetical protein